MPKSKNSVKWWIAFALLVIALGFAYCQKIWRQPASPTAQDEEVANKVFQAQEDGVYAYRIPALIAGRDGTLFALAEARKVSWRDKSPTDVVLKLSTDGMKWSPGKVLMKGEQDAYMDPCPVWDARSGHLYVFAALWPKDDHSGKATRAYMIESTDDGKTWSAPRDMNDVFGEEGVATVGFGPGSGLQIKEGPYAGRLIVPVRQLRQDGTGRNRVVYSDDGGKTWVRGEFAGRGGEYHIAEVPGGDLVFSLRQRGGRAKSTSNNGGASWSKVEKDTLPAPGSGCQGSVLRWQDGVLYCGIKSGVASTEYDDRCDLNLWFKKAPQDKWQILQPLHAKAAGYSDMAVLPSGKIAIIFEGAETPGFTRARDRGKGWLDIYYMLLDPKQLK